MEILDQSGTPELRKAENGSRIVAYIIDAVVIAGLCFIPIIGVVAALAYGLTRDALPFLDGQSIGMGLRAVTTEGAPLTNNWGPCVIRNIVLWIPLFPLVELIVLLTNENGLRLGDQWGKTKVVSVK